MAYIVYLHPNAKMQRTAHTLSNVLYATQITEYHLCMEDSIRKIYTDIHVTKIGTNVVLKTS